MIGLLAGLSIVGCTESVLPPLAAPPVDLTASVAAAQVAADEPIALTLSLYAEEGWTLQLQTPSAEGLSVTQTGQDGPTQAGSRQRTRLSYHLTGEPGSYVIQPGAALAQGPGEQERELIPPPIFVDIGVVPFIIFPFILLAVFFVILIVLVFLHALHSAIEHILDRNFSLLSHCAY